MIIFLYTFAIIFLALVIILGVGNIISENNKETVEFTEGRATAQMCTTRLLEVDDSHQDYTEDDFVIEQDMVYTYDSMNF